MSQRCKYTNERLREIINNEGIGQAVASTIAPEAVADPKLRALWKRAYDTINEIEDILNAA